MENSAIGYSEGSEPIKLTEEQRILNDAREYCKGSPQYPFEFRGYLAGANAERERKDDELNTEKHLVRVYKIQAQCAQERNKELVEALRLAVFYLQGTGRDLSKMESLIVLKSDSK